MKTLFENWKRLVNENQIRNLKYYEKAIEAADTYNDFGWELNDFEIEHLGLVTIDRLNELVTFGSWAKREPKELVNVPPLQRTESLEELDSSKKKNKARQFINRPEIRPPVVLVTAPDSNNDSKYTRIGYGTGIINLCILLGIDQIDVCHLKYKHKVLNHDLARGLPGPPARKYGGDKYFD